MASVCNSTLLRRSLGLANVPRLVAFSNRNISSQEIIEREKKVIANNYDSLPVVICKGSGVHMWDVEGKKYLDFFAGFATLNQGHCHPRIVNTVKEQIGVLHHTARAICHNNLYEASEKLTSLFKYDKVLLTNTGVEGGETAVKLARKWGYRVKKIPAGKAGIIFAAGNFWGRTLAAISASTDPSAYSEFEPLMPGYHIVPYNDLEKLEQKLQDPNICAFMVEPIQGEGGVIVPDAGYLTEVRRLCTKYNVLWIDDEVQAGLGRTGKLLCVHHEEARPDIVILGKALSGGVYPIAAVLADAPIMDCFTPGVHGSTYGGNPLACKILQTALDVILEEKLCDKAEKLGQIFRTELSNRLDKKRVTTVRGKGLLNAVVFNENSLDAKKVSYKLKDNGLVAKQMKPTIIRFSPALTITEPELREGIDIIVDTINTMPVNA
ncbi:ornithine aminotransferase, mitochondrial [Planococcus citri]|uniref:ornithine aminotransferase, mitochondrial n=1 Tax=Planococcus citri TaxID=170843 RepID=UPI0031FA3814